MTETPTINGTTTIDPLAERQQGNLPVADSGKGITTKGPRPARPFASAAEKQPDPSSYAGQDLFSKFLINILMLLTGLLNPDNKNNSPLIGMISKAFGMSDDDNHSEFRQLQGDIKTKGRSAVRDERDYSRFDKEAARDAAKMGEPILGKNIYNSQMLELIGKGESRGDYNIVNTKAQRGIALPKPLTDMSINEVMEWQRVESGRQRAGGDKAPSSAVGKYQFIRATLDETRREMGLTGNEKFDQAMQDKLAMQLLKKSGYEAFMQGRISEEKMVKGVAGKWSSVADLNGRSAHEGIGNNAASISIATTVAAARQDKTILAAGFDSARKGETPAPKTAEPKPPATDNPIIVAGNTPVPNTTPGGMTPRMPAPV